MNKTIPTSKTIITIIILAVLAIGGVLAYQYYWQTPEEGTKEGAIIADNTNLGDLIEKGIKKQEKEEVDTSDWETYKNEEKGYEIKYPKGLEASYGIPGGVASSEGIFHIFIDGFAIMIIGPFDKSDVYNESSEFDENTIVTKTTINGNKARIEEIISIEGPDSVPSYSYEAISYKKSAYIQGPDSNFRISTNAVYRMSSDYQAKIEKRRKDFDKISSTFKFIEIEEEVIDTSNWEIYTNERYGFEFVYPQEWREPKLTLLSTRFFGAFTNGSISKYDNGFTFELGVYYDPDAGKKLTIDEMINTLKNQPYINKVDQENVIIAGKNAQRIEYTYNIGGTITEIYVPIDDKGNIFKASSDTSTIGVSVFNKVINSLKFIK